MPDPFLSFTVPGPPVPKQRPRMGANGTVYTPSRTTDYEDQVTFWARRVMKARKPVQGRVSLTVRVFTKDGRRGDLDNYEKSISDALNGVAWVDDRQVVHKVGSLTERDGDPRVEVEVREL